MATKKDLAKRGGKFANKPAEGLALSEFIDSAGVNNTETAVGLAPPPVPPKKVSSMGRTVEKMLSNPTLVIAGLAAVPLLLVVWGVTRRRRRKRDEEEETAASED